MELLRRDPSGGEDHGRRGWISEAYTRHREKVTRLIAVEDDLLRNHDDEDLGVRVERPAQPVHVRRPGVAAALLRGMAAR
jgi:hypothetical protein